MKDVPGMLNVQGKFDIGTNGCGRGVGINSVGEGDG